MPNPVISVQLCTVVFNAVSMVGPFNAATVGECGIVVRDREDIESIAASILELEQQLADKHVTLEIDDPSVEWLAERGYDSAMGARPMQRVIQEHIKRPMAEELLFGELVKGGHIRITLGDDELKFDLEKH